MNRRDPALVDSRDAIRDYLDTLLREIPDAGDAEAPPPERPVPDPRPSEPPRVAMAPTDATDTTESGATEPARAEAIRTPASAGRPRGRFQALFFEVAGLRLAVALTDLHSVVPRDDVTITPMPDQPAWCLGLMRYRQRNVRVVDTAAMVLPAGGRERSEIPPPSRILVVGDGGWALACHGIGEVVRLEEHEVKWRSPAGKRPWLAGTVIGHLCALVDTGAFTSMLDAPGAAGQ